MRQRRLKNEINVVPYIDVMLVLLVIFMVAAPMLPTATVTLPSVGKAGATPAEPLEVALRKDGELLFTDRQKKGKPESLSRMVLIEKIKGKQAENPEQPVLIAGDKNVRYEEVLLLMDALQKAGIKKVGLLVNTTGK